MMDKLTEDTDLLESLLVALVKQAEEYRAEHARLIKLADMNLGAAQAVERIIAEVKDRSDHDNDG
jgi:hypothetical protein